MHMLLSRWLGSEGYGDLSATLSIALLVTTLALFGFDRSATPTLASYSARSEGRLGTAFARVALGHVVLASLALAALTWLGARGVELASLTSDEHPIRHVAFLVPPMALALLLASLLSGLRRPLLAQLFGQTTYRVLLLALATTALLGATPASAHTAVALVVVAWTVPLAFLGVYLWRAWPDTWIPAAADAAGERRTWRRTARSYLMAILPLVALEESGILIMELIHSSEAAVGVYAAAHRTAGLPLIALAAARQLAVPDLAAARSAGPHAVEAQLKPYLHLVFVAGALILAAFVVLGDPILALFGHATEQGHLILMLLGSAYVVFLCAGLAAPVLQIYGEHRLVIGGMLTMLVASLALGLPAVVLWGGEGLAAAFAAANLTVLGYMMLQVRRRTGVRYLGLLRGARP